MTGTDLTLWDPAPETYAEQRAAERRADCESCGMSDDACTIRILTRKGACCDRCKTTDTHPKRKAAPSWGLDDDIATLVTCFGFDAVEAAVGRVKIAMSGPVGAAPARHDDPRTSKAAAKTTPDVRRFGKDSYSGRLLRVFNEAGKTGLTDHEATSRVLGKDADVTKFEGCRRRCSDLRAAAYLADTGAEDEGRILWAVTSEGREARYRMILSGWSL